MPQFVPGDLILLFDIYFKVCYYQSGADIYIISKYPQKKNQIFNRLPIDRHQLENDAKLIKWSRTKLWKILNLR